MKVNDYQNNEYAQSKLKRAEKFLNTFYAGKNKSVCSDLSEMGKSEKTQLVVPKIDLQPPKSSHERRARERTIEPKKEKRSE